jgi:hypothetical protein
MPGYCCTMYNVQCSMYNVQFSIFKLTLLNKMKTILLSLSAVLLFSFSFQNQSMNKLNNYGNVNSTILKCPAPPPFAETIKNDTKENYVESVTENIDQDWYSKAMKNIQKEEYSISYNKELDAYQSPNRKNNIRFIYHKDGFTAVTREAGGEKEGFSIDIKVSDVKRQTSIGTPPPIPPFSKGGAEGGSA